jgi:hypothetical protein
MFEKRSVHRRTISVADTRRHVVSERYPYVPERWQRVHPPLLVSASWRRHVMWCNVHTVMPEHGVPVAAGVLTLGTSGHIEKTQSVHVLHEGYPAVVFGIRFGYLWSVPARKWVKIDTQEGIALGKLTLAAFPALSDPDFPHYAYGPQPSRS